MLLDVRGVRLMREFYIFEQISLQNVMCFLTLLTKRRKISFKRELCCGVL
jgi:hypothetical protein